MERCFKCGSMRKSVDEYAVCKWCRTIETRRKNGSYNFSEDHKQKISESGKGKIPWNKGKPGTWIGKKHTEESKKKISETKKGSKHSEESKKKMSESHKGKKQSKELIAKRVESRKGYRHSEETRKKIGDGNRDKIISDECKKKMSKVRKGKKWSEEQRQKMIGQIAWNKGIPQTEEAKRKNSEANSGLNNMNWKGGISFEPYSIEFNNKLKKYIRNRDGNRCIRCNNKYNYGRVLTVHHIDYDKMNSNEQNLCDLCCSCNTIVNYNRKHWIKYFQKYIRKLYKLVA